MRLQGELICLGSKSIGSFLFFKHKKNKCIFRFLISASVQQHYCHAFVRQFPFHEHSEPVTDFVLQLGAGSAQKGSWAQLSCAPGVLSARWRMAPPVTYQISIPHLNLLVFLFMSIFNIFDKFHNYRCLNSLNKQSHLKKWNIHIEWVFSKAYEVP